MVEYRAKRAEDIANARLIAAAPELLDALEQMLAATKDGTDFEAVDLEEACRAAEAARAAIAKVRP